jgi:hypothetical protein
MIKLPSPVRLPMVVGGARSAFDMNIGALKYYIGSCHHQRMTMKFAHGKAERQGAGKTKPEECRISECKRLIIFGNNSNPEKNILRFAVKKGEYSTGSTQYLSLKESEIDYTIRIQDHEDKRCQGPLFPQSENPRPSRGMILELTGSGAV